MTRTGQHPWLHTGWKGLPIKADYCLNTSYFRRFQSEANNIDLMHLQPHYYHARQMEPCHQLVEVARRSSGAFELLALFLNNNSKKNNCYSKPKLLGHGQLVYKLLNNMYSMLVLWRTGRLCFQEVGESSPHP